MGYIVGRQREKVLFDELISGKKSEFVVVYGRRRVGKTFLIRELLSKQFSFHITGLANATLDEQLFNFHHAMQNYSNSKKRKQPTHWLEAFQQLISILSKSKQPKKIVFFDELPWLDTPKSGFIQALEHFWNSWASARNDVVLVVCGSAASWMINKIIKNKGGLHNRVTQKIRLAPFTLHECELMLQAKGVVWNKYQIAEAYMALGGIPYYWSHIKKGKSAAQAIDELCFAENAILKDEYQNLYASLFKNSEGHELIVKTLSKKTIGLSRKEIIALSKLPNGGGTTKILEELETSGFIRKYKPIGRENRESIYQLLDFYSLFYYQFIHKQKNIAEDYWQKNIDHPSHRAWAGYAFEQLCLIHLPQIKKALGISGVETEAASWRGKSNKCQIDLLIDRRDQIINLCEMKYAIGEIEITKKYADELRNKMQAFKSETKTKKAVHLTFVSTYGAKQNQHSSGLIQQEIKLNALFEP